jgi:hypothetical protein
MVYVRQLNKDTKLLIIIIIYFKQHVFRNVIKYSFLHTLMTVIFTNNVSTLHVIFKATFITSAGLALIHFMMACTVAVVVKSGILPHG